MSNQRASGVKVLRKLVGQWHKDPCGDRACLVAVNGGSCWGGKAIVPPGSFSSFLCCLPPPQSSPSRALRLADATLHYTLMRRVETAQHQRPPPTCVQMPSMFTTQLKHSAAEAGPPSAASMYRLEQMAQVAPSTLPGRAHDRQSKHCAIMPGSTHRHDAHTCDGAKGGHLPFSAMPWSFVAHIDWGLKRRGCIVCDTQAARSVLPAHASSAAVPLPGRAGGFHAS